MKLTFKHFWNFSFILEFFFYSFSLFLAIGIALNLLAKMPVSEKITLPREFAAWEFIITFILGTIIILLILKYSKKPYFIQVLFYLAILQGLLIFSKAYFDWPYFLVILIIILLYWLIYQNVLIHDVVISLSASAISVIFGLNLMPNMAVIILILLAFYDVWAVYKTKHMIDMFHKMARAKVHFALIIPYNFKGLLAKIKEVMPETEFMFLGTGDIAIPAIFVVSCLKINLLTSLLSAGGAILGFIFLYLLFIAQKERKPMPGLPPIIFGTLIGYLISFLF